MKNYYILIRFKSQGKNEQNLSYDFLELRGLKMSS